MITEHSTENTNKQLTMVLMLEFWDELETRRVLPPRPHYFDFDQWKWIPQLTEQKQEL